MTYDQAIELLRKEGWMQPNGDLDNPAKYISCKRVSPSYCTLDGEFDLDELEAIVVYLRHVEAEFEG